MPFKPSFAFNPTHWIAALHRRKRNLYGTTPKGGIYQGVLYKLSKGGKFTLLHSVAGNGDGCYPPELSFLELRRALCHAIRHG
jgi:uncharacterized repeat protein (TIGR03803 family)